MAEQYDQGIPIVIFGQHVMDVCRGIDRIEFGIVIDQAADMVEDIGSEHHTGCTNLSRGQSNGLALVNRLNFRSYAVACFSGV